MEDDDELHYQHVLPIRSSIDYSLELERQLDALDSPHGTHFPHASSLDPEVLSSIVIQLRNTLEQFTHERDELASSLVQAQANSATMEARAFSLEEQLEAQRKRADEAEAQLAEWKQKAEDNENQVGMLRSKVEESRRGVMRLQAESRRRSQIIPGTPVALDIPSSARTPASALSSKRMSFGLASPVASSAPGSFRPGVGHRRISSLSDPGFRMPESIDLLQASQGSITPPSPYKEIDVKSSPPKPAPLYIPRNEDFISQPDIPNPLAAEVDTLRAELASVKRELIDTKEAREASETCLRILREFVAQQNADPENPKDDVKGLKLPPLPTDSFLDEEEEKALPPKPEEEVKPSGWGGLRLWRTGSVSSSSQSSIVPSGVRMPNNTPNPSYYNPRSPTVTEATEGPSPLSNFVSSWTKSVDKSAAPLPPTPALTDDKDSLKSSVSSPAPSIIANAKSRFGFFGRSNSTSTPPSFTKDLGETGSMGGMSLNDTSITTSEKSEPVSPTGDDDVLVELPLKDDDHKTQIERGDITPRFGGETGFAV
jgi:uncharacterized coiled-coil protein SlyX